MIQWLACGAALSCLWLVHRSGVTRAPLPRIPTTPEPAHARGRGVWLRGGACAGATNSAEAAGVPARRRSRFGMHACVVADGAGRHTERDRPALGGMRMTEIIAIATPHGQFAYSPTTPPCATVFPGTTVRVATRDPRSGALIVGPPGTFQPYPPPPGGRTNALTGPIRVEGAEPGDVLVVDVRDIVLQPPGYMAANDAGLVVPKGRVGESLIGIVDVKDGHVVWREGLRFPCRPMVGEIGVADPSASRSGAVGRFGGNMDHAVLGAGCRLYLPVLAPGALLYIGDVHAAMGDGELSGGGVEIPAEVTCTIDLVRRRSLPAPRMETADRVITVGWDRDFAAARAMAVEDMLTLLETRLGMRAVEALMVISAAGDLRVGQACGSMDLTLRLEMPKRWPRLTAAP